MVCPYIHLESYETINTDIQFQIGALPTFHETPSAELDALLSTFRTNVFMPAQLIRLQKDLIYKRKNWSLLNSGEPATVRLGDEILQLRPLDRTKDEPNSRATFNKVLALMAETGDWSVLPGFLEGLKTAGRRLEPGLLEKIVRKAVEAGKTGVVIECLKRVDATGLGLWDLGVAREVMWGATALAIQGEWSKGAVVKGVRYAENVLDMMFEPEHGAVQGDHPRTRPEILGLLLQIHATKVVLFDETGDEAGMVAKYARMMLTHWILGHFEAAHSDWVDANYTTVTWAPVSHGMKLASQVLGKQAALGKLLAQKMEQDLEPLLQKAQILVRESTPEGGRRRGLVVSEELATFPF